ncbi:MAG: SRPBCC family protein [Terriglobales bacterium]
MPVASMNTIEQQVTIRAPRSRVWEALTTPSELGTWFHCTLTAKDFSPGETINGVSTYPGCEGKAFVLEIVEKVPKERFSWRWSPGLAASDDPPTTVTFTLEEVTGGTRVTVTESGFDRISLERRAKAFEDNTQGWKIQMQNLSDYAQNQ